MARTPVAAEEDGIPRGVCVDMCPEVFRLNDRDVSEVYNPAGAPEEKNQEALDACPGQCLRRD